MEWSLRVEEGFSLYSILKDLELSLPSAEVKPLGRELSQS
jgi:hypothetical protein